MPSLDESFPAILDVLLDQYGRPGGPFAALEPFEAMLAAVLDRVHAPEKRDKILAAFREEGLLDPQAFAEANHEELQEVLRAAHLSLPPAALRLFKSLPRWLIERHHGMVDELVGESDVSTAQLRDELLAVRGIGQSSADAILLFALRRPVYPLDRPTYRILARHGWIDPDAQYDDARDVVERLVPDDPDLLVALSSWFESVGRKFCRVQVPKCEKCPLRPFLPDGGPIDPSGG
jgi:endonuclease III related protein